MAERKPKKAMTEEQLERLAEARKKANEMRKVNQAKRLQNKMDNLKYNGDGTPKEQLEEKELKQNVEEKELKEPEVPEKELKEPEVKEEETVDYKNSIEETRLLPRRVLFCPCHKQDWSSYGLALYLTTQILISSWQKQAFLSYLVKKQSTFWITKAKPSHKTSLSFRGLIL